MPVPLTIRPHNSPLYDADEVNVIPDTVVAAAAPHDTTKNVLLSNVARPVDGDEPRDLIDQVLTQRKALNVHHKSYVNCGRACQRFGLSSMFSCVSFGGSGDIAATPHASVNR